MELKILAETVSKFAPLLGSVIATSNPIAGIAIKLIANIFNANSNPDDIVAQISKDPDAAIKLKQLEYEHQDALLNKQITQQQISAEDTQDARKREEEIVKLTGKRDIMLDILAILVVFGFFALCLVNYFVHITDDHIIVMLIGQISSGFMLCLSYYFGSSNKQ